MELKGIQFLTLCLAVCIFDGHARAPKKIQHGHNADDGQFPYQVYLQIRNYACSGSIIQANWILTAAHCVVSKTDGLAKPSDIQIVTGVVDLRNGWYDNPVANVIVHPRFDRKAFPKSSVFADIALLKLVEPIDFDYYKQSHPILLPEGDTPPGTKAIVSGWGIPFFGAKESMMVLQKLNMTVLDLAECRKMNGNRDGNLISAANICAKGNVRGSGTCQGDSGGPLVANNRLIGMVSVSQKCGEGLGDVFTNVKFFLPWISSMIKNYS